MAMFPPELRATLRRTYAGKVPAKHLDEVVDIGMHAAEQALRAMVSTLEAASEGKVGFSSLTLAMSLLVWHLQNKIDEVPEQAALLGMTHETAIVTLETVQ